MNGMFDGMFSNLFGVMFFALFILFCLMKICGVLLLSWWIISIPLLISIFEIIAAMRGIKNENA